MESVTFDVGTLGQEEVVVPTFEPVADALEEDIGSMAKGPLPGESLVLEVEMDIPIASSKVIASITALDELEEPIT